MLLSDKDIQYLNKLGACKVPFLFIIDFEGRNTIILPLTEIDSDSILYQTSCYQNYSSSIEKIDRVEFTKFPISYSEYLKAFEYIKTNIINGNSYLANLTFATPMEINLSLNDIFIHSKAKYKLYIKDKFVCFSPEIFIRINNNIISSYPMKGTIDADRDEALKTILEDEKEFAEHNTIVDLIRNDLSLVSKQVRVQRFRYSECINTHRKSIIQISSEISGILDSGWSSNIGDILNKLLPAGSISGAPKLKTLEIIKNAEISNRGYYTGIFGIFDGITLDSAVLIRFIELKDGQLYYRSGGGITALSNAVSEYNELIDKVYVPIY